MKHYETIIIGGGISGCILGYLLKKQKKSVNNRKDKTRI